MTPYNTDHLECGESSVYVFTLTTNDRTVVDKSKNACNIYIFV